MFATKNQTCHISTTSDTSTVISSDEEEFESRNSFAKTSLNDNASNPWIKRINCVGSGSTEKHEHNLMHETSLRQERSTRSNMCSNLNKSSSLLSASNIYELNQSASGNTFSDSDYFRNEKYKPQNPLVLTGAAKYTVSAHRVKFNN